MGLRVKTGDIRDDHHRSEAKGQLKPARWARSRYSLTFGMEETLCLVFLYRIHIIDLELVQSPR